MPSIGKGRLDGDTLRGAILSLVCGATVPAGATDLAADPPHITFSKTAEVIDAPYTCDGLPFPVRYINDGENDLAILSDGDVTRIFVNTISASGSRYVSGQLEWWVKGAEATLRDLSTDNVVATCTTAEN